MGNINVPILIKFLLFIIFLSKKYLDENARSSTKIFISRKVPRIIKLTKSSSIVFTCESCIITLQCSMYIRVTISLGVTMVRKGGNSFSMGTSGNGPYQGVCSFLSKGSCSVPIAPPPPI